VSAAAITISRPTPLDALRCLVLDDLSRVDAIIFDLIKSKALLIPEISEHTITSGGKRLRPMLTLACANLCGYRGDAHINLAASVEFIHTATLLHDDVVDKSDLRRGTMTANNLWGNKESILVGDFLLGKAFELMGAASSLEVYRVLSKAAVVISEGEVLQLALTGRINISEREYFEVIKAKTAELFSASCAIGGIITGVKDEEIQALESYGINLGSAFQIVDDALDYSASSEKLGKNIGDDFVEKKVTLPVIIAYRQASEKQKKFWEYAFAKTTPHSTELLQEAMLIIKDGDVIAQVIKIARNMTITAGNSMRIFPDSPIKQALLDMLEFVVGRGY
jgi:octaprenyl-diphosphate synthase